MKIHELRIRGFKSIAEIKLVEPNSFSVFVGPNAAGKSNIFEAFEFFQLCNNAIPQQVLEGFGNIDEIKHQENYTSSDLNYFFDLGIFTGGLNIPFESNNFKLWSYSNYGKMFHITNPPLIEAMNSKESASNSIFEKPDYSQLTNYSRLFVGNPRLRRIINDDSRLASDASNLEKVLKRIFKNEKDKEEIIEILQLLIPGFSGIDIKTEELSGTDNLIIYEYSLKKPLTKRLISDGTYNIIAIIAAIFQSEQPQFLCIEEPENGLNPKVVKQLVSLFRDKCKEKGHYIWLNTHSQTLVSELTTDEIILVDKVDGNTQTKQVKGMDLHGLRMDEALLTNALGGGIPW